MDNAKAAHAPSGNEQPFMDLEPVLCERLGASDG